MKILYLGHYREGNTGWSRAAQELITAFDSVGADIVCRPVVLSGGGTPSDTVLKCEAKSAKNCDIIIQNLLPHHMVYSGKFKKNIAIPFVETYLSNDNDWLQNLKLMDEVWCSTPKYLQNLIPHTRLKYIDIPTDTDKYVRTYPKVNIPQIYNDYVFYYIGDVNKRKNIQALVRAYYMAFTKYDPVSLVLKVNKFGFSPDKLHKTLVEEIRFITEGMRIYPRFEDYKQIVLITEDLTDAQVMGLHRNFDCYVSSSCGEGLNFPLVDAFGTGNKVISTNYPKSIFDKDVYTVETYINPCYNVQDNFPGQFTSNDSWLETNINDLAFAMKSAVDHSRTKNVTRDLSFMTYKNCGERMMELIYE